MTETIEVPECYTEAPPNVRYSTFKRPFVRIRDQHKRGSKALRCFQATSEALGDPEAIRFFIDNDRVALLPASSDHPHAYPFWRNGTNGGGDVAATWLQYELESGLPEDGLYPVERDGDLWIVDFAAGPVDEEVGQ